jgi:hypothetical protein
MQAKQRKLILSKTGLLCFRNSGAVGNLIGMEVRSSLPDKRRLNVMNSHLASHHQIPN